MNATLNRRETCANCCGAGCYACKWMGGYVLQFDVNIPGDCPSFVAGDPRGIYTRFVFLPAHAIPEMLRMIYPFGAWYNTRNGFIYSAHSVWHWHKRVHICAVYQARGSGWIWANKLPSREVVRRAKARRARAEQLRLW